MTGTWISDEINYKEDLTTALKRLIAAVIKSGYSLAIWRKPGDEEINVIVDLSDHQPNAVQPDLESLPEGFLASPFHNESNLLSYFIKADLHWKGKNGRLKKINRSGSGYPDSRYQLFNASLQEPVDPGTPVLPASEHNAGEEKKKEDFKKMILSALEEIKSQQFIKVVPSRRKSLVLSDKFNLIESFNALTALYPDAFVSMFTLPGKGIWMGATPELIIGIDKKNIFHTSAVAGTQSAEKYEQLSSVAWTQKEIEEQALVSRYIINCFKKIRLREFKEFGPKTIRASNLMHLRTDFMVDINAVKFPKLGSVMLKLLHPTSAVCGMPKEPAIQFIQRHEGYDREFYSGYIGPVNMDNQTELYVNLRCAQFLGKKAYLYSGAGVTIDSDPDREWRETLLKNQTIENLLSGIQ